MKRKMFSILAIAAIALTSCKKDEPASSELGEATITGNVWADMDQTNNVIEGVNGMQVTVIVDTYDWDQNPDNNYDYEERVFTTTTDASGNYTLTIPATEEGYNITLEFEDLHTTRITATGTQNVKVTRNNIGKYIYAGAMISTSDEATVTEANGSGSAGDVAWITGKIYVVYDNTSWQAPTIAQGDQLLNSASALGTRNVVWNYDAFNTPFGNTDNTTYSVSIDYTTGTYTLTIPTEGLSGNSVCFNFGILDFAGSQINDNMAGTADSNYVGHYTDNGGVNANFDCISAGEITNYDIYLNFVDHN